MGRLRSDSDEMSACATEAAGAQPSRRNSDDEEDGAAGAAIAQPAATETDGDSDPSSWICSPVRHPVIPDSSDDCYSDDHYDAVDCIPSFVREASAAAQSALLQLYLGIQDAATMLLDLVPVPTVSKIGRAHV